MFRELLSSSHIPCFLRLPLPCWTSPTAGSQRKGVGIFRVYGSCVGIGCGSTPEFPLPPWAGRPSPCILAQTPPWRPQPLHPCLSSVFPPLDLDVSFQPSVLELIPSAFPRDQPFPNLPCRCSLLSPPLPAFACSFQGLSRFLSLSGISAVADKDACWFWAGSASWGG